MGLFDRKKSTPKPSQSPPSAATLPVGEVVPESIAGQIPTELPAVSVRNNVIFPHTVVPVFFEDKKSMQALAKAQKSDRLIAAFSLNDKARARIEREANSQTEPEPSSKPTQKTKSPPKPSLTPIKPLDLYRIGTVCRIERVMPVTDRDGVLVVLQGLVKVRALDIIETPQHMFSLVEPIMEKPEESREIKALMKNALGTAQKIIQHTPYLPPELQHALGDLTDPLKFVYLLATLIRFDVGERQMILEENSVEQKLKKTAAILSRELEEIELGGKIVSNVREKFGKMSREAFLRQQLKEIKEELGEESESQQEAKNYRDKMKKAKLPEKVAKEVDREIRRLEDMHPHSSEYQVVRTYLDWIFDLPWEFKKSKKKAVGLSEVEKTLHADHYGLKDVKERILEYLAVRELNKSHKGPILCFVGPPGVGKTSLGKSIARALNREFVRMSLGGVRDESEIRGHRRTYVGALPGRVIQGIRRAGTLDPVFMLDEIDKVGADFRGDPSSALLEVLDPEQNDTFQDHYLDVEYDLSNVLFIATANVLDTIQPALLDRMEVIDLAGYINEEKKAIARQYLWPRVLKRHGLKKNQLKLKDDVWDTIIDQYTREAGVRNFEKQLARMARKVAHQVVRGEQKSLTVDEKKLRNLLGPQKIYPEIAARTAQPGVATGLAYTQAGGTILFIEATQMPGGKHFEMTGSLGNVMKESARAALSLVRGRAGKLGIKSDHFKKYDIHLHVPSGAIPKDGPSAGVAMVTALASLLTGKKARNDVAMTGEITLTGQVLPIGGVKEKVLAAKRAGIKTVILPDKNENDLSEIDAELLKDIEFKFVDNIDQVIELAVER